MCFPLASITMQCKISQSENGAADPGPFDEFALCTAWLVKPCDFLGEVLHLLFFIFHLLLLSYFVIAFPTLV